MGEQSHDFKTLVFLQNSMELLKGECGANSEMGVTSFLDESEVIVEGVEEVTDTKEDKGQLQKLCPVFGTEHDVSCWSVFMT
jgi:hypothetical protein